MATSEKILEILQQICDKFGIIMDENIYSLSELANALTEQIAMRYLIADGIHLIINLIIIGLCVKFFKERHEEEDFKSRAIKLVSLLNPKKSVLKEKMENDRNFNFEKYLIDFIVMVFLIMIVVPLVFSCIDQTIEIIKVFVCPDLLVLDYMMDYYLNYTPK